MLLMNLNDRNLTFQDIETDTAEAINVGMVDLGEEADLRGAHRIVFGEEELQTEDTAFVWGLGGAVDLDGFARQLMPRDSWYTQGEYEKRLQKHQNNGGYLHEERR